MLSVLQAAAIFGGSAYLSRLVSSPAGQRFLTEGANFGRVGDAARRLAPLTSPDVRREIGAPLRVAGQVEQATDEEE
jgi:hypothetical protein